MSDPYPAQIQAIAEEPDSVRKSGRSWKRSSRTTFLAWRRNRCSYSDDNNKKDRLIIRGAQSLLWYRSRQLLPFKLLAGSTRLHGWVSAGLSWGCWDRRLRRDSIR